jgi:hypothetical protein
MAADWAVINGSEYLCGWGQGRAYGETGEFRRDIKNPYRKVPTGDFFSLSLTSDCPPRSLLVARAECYLHKPENQRPVIWDDEVESVR